MRRENRRMNKVIEQLRSDLKRGSEMFNNMMEFTKPGGKNRNAIREVAEMKIDLERGEKRLAETRTKLIERNSKYDELWAHKVEKDRILKATEKQLEVLKERNEAADGV